MTRWEYLTLNIHYDGKKRKDWVVHYRDGTEQAGLGDILRTHGAAGWELVSLNVEQFSLYTAFARYDMVPTDYRATFKRPLTA